MTISAEEKRARIDTAHECIRHMYGRNKTKELFVERHSVHDWSTINAWKRKAREEIRDELEEHVHTQAAVSAEQLDEIAAKAVAEGDYNAAVRAIAEKNKVLVPSADAKTAAAAQAASARHTTDPDDYSDEQLLEIIEAGSVKKKAGKKAKAES